MSKSIEQNSEEFEKVTQFEQQYSEEILPFVKKQGHASCTEWMKEFKITYTSAVKFMDALELRDIVGVGEHTPRPLLNGREKKCPTPTVSLETTPVPPKKKKVKQ